MFLAIWRTELWHPISVHFPIALLLGATISFFVSFFRRDGAGKQWRNAANGMLLTGCAAAWIAIYTGDLADGIVSRTLCDPTVLKAHELASFTMVYLFSSATIVNLITFTSFIRVSWKKEMHYVVFVLMITGSGYLVYTGHLGASLVYEQGAGVNKPSADCAGFE